MYLRAGFTVTAGWTLAKGMLLSCPSFPQRLTISSPAITIAIRYATIRRQGAPDPTSVDPSVSTPGAPVLEMPVLRYPSTYARLLPVLARAYVLIGLGRSVVRSYFLSPSSVCQMLSIRPADRDVQGLLRDARKRGHDGAGRDACAHKCAQGLRYEHCSARHRGT